MSPLPWGLGLIPGRGTKILQGSLWGPKKKKKGSVMACKLFIQLGVQFLLNHSHFCSDDSLTTEWKHKWEWGFLVADTVFWKPSFSWMCALGIFLLLQTHLFLSSLFYIKGLQDPLVCRQAWPERSLWRLQQESRWQEWREAESYQYFPSWLPLFKFPRMLGQALEEGVHLPNISGPPNNIPPPL